MLALTEGFHLHGKVAPTHGKKNTLKYEKVWDADPSYWIGMQNPWRVHGSCQTEQREGLL